MVIRSPELKHKLTFQTYKKMDLQNIDAKMSRHFTLTRAIKGTKIMLGDHIHNKKSDYFIFHYFSL